MKRLRAGEARAELTEAESLADELHLESEAIAYRRDRLLAALTLIAGAGLAIALPFALRAGAEFFLPVTAALVIAIALVPLLEWFERRRVPSSFAALICVLLFIAVANMAIAAIVLPATEWVRLLPERIGRIRETLAPLLDVYASLERFIDDVVTEFGDKSGPAARTVTVETPNSVLDLIATSAPHAAIQMFFAILVIFFFLAGWTRMRKRTITTRTSFDGAMTTARVIQQVVDATSTYLGTITFVNISMGAFVSLVLWLLEMPTPLMWGGIVAVLNYIPYLGPIASILLLALGGLMAFADPWYAFLPALSFAAIHLIEANFVTPAIVGKRLTINPLLILVALSFWAWVWGTTGALLAVPLLIILKTVLDAAGKPDIAGFLFEEGTLTSTHHEDFAEVENNPQMKR
ncbi:AI-2E family transporter [Sphingomonas sp. LY54]|uniref:AI-2E family transporter n=1 Tax=Sphingomonadales TaxID=204457 RepID=UPI002ADEBDB8|nr:MULTISPECIES: AI-2E family transporter [Sphingomonadales]MEA1013226.1 AI-2E family transporter [Sphingosinicella sp. LY1275]WRP28633.1 AI-2E family transporter [Sphingomonas sp. LY54]